MFGSSLIAVCIVFGAVGQVLLKTGMSQVGQIGGLGKPVQLGTLSRMFTTVYVIGRLLLCSDR